MVIKTNEIVSYVTLCLWPIEKRVNKFLDLRPIIVIREFVRKAIDSFRLSFQFASTSHGPNK